MLCLLAGIAFSSLVRAQAPVALAVDAGRDQRVAQLVARMTLEEKVSQMRNHAAAIPRLGIPAYDYWSEGLHGIARSGYATLFPQAIGMAATWDTALVHREAEVISVEARAKHTQAVREGNFDIFYGLTIWSPNINIFRDPRWGRGQETYGEDPFLTGRLGVAFVAGLQGDSARYLRTVATPKHFAVHSGPESERHRFNAAPSPHDFEDTYLPAFRAAVAEGHAQSVMCAYNAIDGAPACANPHLLSDILRKAWKFDGFITSDCGAIEDIAVGHAYAKDVEHASVAAVRAGTDTSCGAEYDSLVSAVHDGLISESELDTAVRRLFVARFRLGMFDPPAKVAYEQIPFSEVDSPEHAALALQAARESMVLLKNEGALPLAAAVKTVGVIGPNAASLAALEGNYNAVPSHPVTPLDGLRTALAGRAEVLYAQGSGYVDPLPIVVPETALDLRGEYYANLTYSGKPVTVRKDRRIDFDWNMASPVSGVSAKAFSVRWTGTMTAPAAGDYRLSLALPTCWRCGQAESYALYLDGKPLGEDGKLLGERQPGAGHSSGDGAYLVHFADTRPHTLRVDFAHTANVGSTVSLKWAPPPAALLPGAVKVAERSDVVIAFVGLSPDLEGEEMPVHVEGFSGGDRTDIALPAAQQQMLEAVAKTGKPLVVVLMNGSALAVNWAEQHASAILEAWYPGEAGGTAIAETLLGQNNPAGRLPVTFYKSITDLPPFTDYSMRGRTYRYVRTAPLYGFGYGLSYTHFTYSAPTLSASKVNAGDPLTVRVHLVNRGPVAGDEVIEAYVKLPAPGIDHADLVPIRALVGFSRIHLNAQEGRDVAITVDPRQLSQVDAGGRRQILPGEYRLYIGGGQPESADSGMQFVVTGSEVLPE